MSKKITVQVGHIEEEGIKLPKYKTIVIEDVFTKVYDVFYEMLTKLEKSEILLAFYLVKQMDYSGVIYSNKIFRDRFIEHVNKESQGKIQYKHQTVYQAFNSLKKEGIIIAHKETTGAYFINPAYLHIGDPASRRLIFSTITKETYEKSTSTI